jgi:hypothetical protein
MTTQARIIDLNKQFYSYCGRMNNVNDHKQISFLNFIYYFDNNLTLGNIYYVNDSTKYYIYLHSETSPKNIYVEPENLSLKKLSTEEIKKMNDFHICYDNVFDACSCK